MRSEEIEFAFSTATANDFLSTGGISCSVGRAEVRVSPDAGVALADRLFLGVEPIANAIDEQLKAMKLLRTNKETKFVPPNSLAINSALKFLAGRAESPVIPFRALPSQHGSVHLYFKSYDAQRRAVLEFSNDGQVAQVLTNRVTGESRAFTLHLSREDFETAIAELDRHIG